MNLQNTGIPLESEPGHEEQNDIRFACPNCGQHLKCDRRGVGHMIECPTCDAAFAAPSPEDLTTARTQGRSSVA